MTVLVGSLAAAAPPLSLGFVGVVITGALSQYA